MLKTREKQVIFHQVKNDLKQEKGKIGGTSDL